MIQHFAKGEEEFFLEMGARKPNGSDLARWVYLFRPKVYERAVRAFGHNPTGQELASWLHYNRRKTCIVYGIHHRLVMKKLGIISYGCERSEE